MSVLTAIIHPDHPVCLPPHEHVCPQCNSSVERVPRRPIDRFASLFTPVHRYRCRLNGWGCDWEGNLR